MKKLLFAIKKQILLLMLFFLSLASCKKSEEINTGIVLNTPTDSIIEADFESKILADLYESNKKLLAISEAGFGNINDVAILKLIIKIHINQQNVRQNLIKVTEENLIIIPKSLEINSLDQESLQSENANEYVLIFIEDQIKFQIEKFSLLENTTNYNSLRNLAKQEKSNLEYTLISLMQFKNT